MAGFQPRLLHCLAALAALAAVALGLWPRMAKRRMREALRTAQAQESSWPGNPLLSNISGSPKPPFITSQRVRELSDGTFRHRSSDVWVVTYPKCGTTWTQAIVASLLGREIDGVTPGHFERYCPWPERAVGKTTLAALEAMPAPRCLKSHWSRRDHMALRERGKVVYVMRNVLDVAVSAFHHYNDFLNLWDNSTTWEDFFRLFLDGDALNGDYFAHVASWWPRRKDPDVLLLRYEEMKREPQKQIRRIADFLGLQGLSDEQVGKAMEATDFRRMRELEEKLWPRLKRWLGLRKDFRMRSGVTGEGGAKLTVGERAALQQRYEETLERLGVPWDWILDSA